MDPTGLYANQVASGAYNLLQSGSLVPGGQASMQAFSQWGQGDILGGTLSMVRGVGEAGLAVASLGESALGLQGGRAVIGTAERTVASVGLDDASAAAGTDSINFNTSHYVNRVGVDNINSVEGMARNIVSNPDFVPGTSLCFTCNSVNYQMRTFVLPNGGLNVGTIFPIQ